MKSISKLKPCVFEITFPQCGSKVFDENERMKNVPDATAKLFVGVLKVVNLVPLLIIQY